MEECLTPYVPNAKYTPDIYFAPHHTKITYTCDDDYYLDGASIITCLPSDWDYEPPRCLRKLTCITGNNQRVQSLFLFCLISRAKIILISGLCRDKAFTIYCNLLPLSLLDEYHSVDTFFETLHLAQLGRLLAQTMLADE